MGRLLDEVAQPGQQRFGGLTGPVLQRFGHGQQLAQRLIDVADGLVGGEQQQAGAGRVGEAGQAPRGQVGAGGGFQQGALQRRNARVGSRRGISIGIGISIGRGKNGLAGHGVGWRQKSGPEADR